VAGARLLGLSLDEFLRVAGAHGVLTLDYDPDDFEQEIESIRATAGRA
jgi:predicted HTH domain antitoxin